VPLPPLPARAVAEDAGGGAWAPPTWFSGEYRYDGSGNIKSIGAPTSIHGDGKSTLNGDGQSDTYVYDTAGRLVSGTVNHGATNTETYAYDSFGNRIQKQTNGALAVSLPVSPNTNRMDGHEYDRAGNLTAQAGTSDIYFYDAVNQLRQHTFGPGPTDYARYVYTADDERIGVEDGDGWVRWMFRDLEGKVLREYEGKTSFHDDYNSWLWIEDYVYGEGKLIAAKREEAEGGTRHFHLDHLGTPRLITSATGMKYALHDYYAFGTEQSNARQEMEDYAHERPEPMKFTGHERDYTKGTYHDNGEYLDYMHARYYSPQWGRSLSVDPVFGKPALPQSWNRYAYVRNNPLNLTDPAGREAQKPRDKNSGTGCGGNTKKGQGADGRRQGTVETGMTLNYLPEGDPSRSAAKTSQAPPNTILINAHGSRRTLAGMGPAKLAAKIATDAKQVPSGTTIILNSCDSARGNNSIAQELSSIMHTKVIGNDQPTWTNGPLDVGTWGTLGANGRQKSGGWPDPTTPGHRVTFVDVKRQDDDQ
jgi:RHS repeat-associated protein